MHGGYIPPDFSCDRSNKNSDTEKLVLLIEEKTTNHCNDSTCCLAVTVEEKSIMIVASRLSSPPLKVAAEHFKALSTLYQPAKNDFLELDWCQVAQ